MSCDFAIALVSGEIPRIDIDKCMKTEYNYLQVNLDSAKRENMDIDRFTTNEFRTLKQMYDSMVTLPDGSSFVPLSQAELARLIGVSANTMNSYFKFFTSDKYIDFVSKRKYALTDKAIRIVQKINEI